MPYAVENELTAAGSALLSVANTIEAWLTRAPRGPIALGSVPAKAAIRALIGGWGSTMLHALVTRPLSLTELDGLIEGLSYHAVERRLSAMRAARQVERLPEQGQSTPYAVTDWARQAVAPLAVAGRCECRHIEGETEPPTGLDIEAVFLLAVPLASLPEDASGPCLLGVDTGAVDAVEGERRLAGVRVGVDRGRVATCVSRLEEEPRTWAVGTVESWLDAIIDRQLDRLRIGGADAELAQELVGAIHDALFLE